MAIITISRGSFSGGVMLAECLAARLGYRMIGRETIVQRAAAEGASEQELLDALLKPPGLMERFRHTRYKYLTLLQGALAEEVRSGNAVYHGNAGHLLLQDGSPILCVRVIAPLEFRTAMAMARLRCSRSQAVAYITRVDAERRRWTRYLYGVDWEDPALYDAIINLERAGIEQACDVIVTMARQRCLAITPECRAWMENLALASGVKARLALDPATSHLEFDVTADGGRVAIGGKLPRPEEMAEVRRVATATAGVTAVDLSRLAPGGPPS
jgi:cytidylate kinase